jgi:hypothetical protein
MLFLALYWSILSNLIVAFIIFWSKNMLFFFM